MDNYPEVSDADMAFGQYPGKWFSETLKKATAAGFGTNNCDRASGLFFSGGKVDYDRSLDSDFLNSGTRILRAVLGSFEPKHEHKMVVCEYIINSMETAR